MTPRIEALLAVDPRDLTDDERAVLSEALALDDDALETALAVASDAELAEDIPDPFGAAGEPAVERPAVRSADGERKWFAVAAAIVLVAVVAIYVALRSSSDEGREAVRPTPGPPTEREPLREPARVVHDGLRELPAAGGARPKPRKAPNNKQLATAHSKRGLNYSILNDHESAAFAYVDAFRAMPSDPSLAFLAASQMEHAKRCDDALVWFRFAVTLEPGAKYVKEANERADGLERECDGDDHVISLRGPNEAESRVRHERGSELYDAGEYRGAAWMFASAYEGLPVGAVAYNVAAAYHRSDDCANTVAWFHHYLDFVEETAERKRIEGLIGAYEKVGCEDAVTHPPPEQHAANDPKRRFAPPKEIAFSDPKDDKEERDDDSGTSASELANRASEAAKKGNYGRAYKLCDDALELDPNTPKARMVCTISACKMKNAKRARRHYERLSDSSKRAVRELCLKTVGVDLGGSDDEAAGEALPERIDRTDISAGISKVRGNVMACADRGDSGTVTVKIKIEPDGSVASATTTNDSPVSRCVGKAVKKARFPRSQKGIVVNYPFVFRGGGDEPELGAFVEGRDLPEQLSRTQLSKVMQTARGRIAKCGEKHGYTGTMKVRMRIEPNGRVSLAKADTSGDVGQCVETIIRRLKFPEAQKIISVSYPFVFR